MGVEKGAQLEVCLIFSKSREKISVNLIFCQTAAARELPPPDFPMIATVVSTSSMETGAVEEAFFRTLHVLCHSVYRALSFAAAFRSLLHAGKREP